jgi:hypothetical protein
VGVHAQLGRQHVGGELADQRWHRLAKGPHVQFLAGVDQERQVDAVSIPGAGPDLLGGAGAGIEEDAGLVQRDGQHPIGVVESRLDAVGVDTAVFRRLTNRLRHHIGGMVVMELQDAHKLPHPSAVWPARPQPGQ